MRSVRKIVTRFSQDMVESIKGSFTDFEVQDLGGPGEFTTSPGLRYFNDVVWEVGEDIFPVRPEKEVFEVFVGFDSEYTAVRVWDTWEKEEYYHASISSRHVEGPNIFQELVPKARRKVERRNKTKTAGFKNLPISYQFCVFSPRLGILRNLVILTNGQKVKFKDLIARLTDFIMENGRIETLHHPILRLFLISHFSLAELQTFSDFHEIKREFDGIRGTFLTMGAPVELNAQTPATLESGLDVEIYLNDTALLAPAGYQNLDSLGRVVGMEKISLPEFYKARMDKLLADDRSKFLEYAIKDSVIALAYWVGVHAITAKSINQKLYQTVGSIAMGYFNNFLKEAKITRKRFFSSDSAQFELYEKFAIKAFHGGRNESIHVGRISGKILQDVDLAGAYSIAMAHLPQLDHSRAFTSTDLGEFTANTETMGIAEVEFEYPEGVAFPCLPVKTKNGLIYPRSGTSTCTSYEVQVACGQGARLKLIAGLIIPAAEGEGVLKRFVTSIRSERAKHKKGTLENNFYKLILNSLYGRFALGISPKQFFNTRSGTHEAQARSANSNPYLASLITGYIRAVLSELAHELSVRGYLVVSMTTDGLITDCPMDVIAKEIESPMISSFKATTVGIGMSGDSWIELKTSTEELFSWKTRGQFSLDHGKISAMAGLQQPRGVEFEALRGWVLEKVAGDDVKALNEVSRLSSLLEVYKGSPFGKVEYLKYISTQYDFKRRLIEYDKTSLNSAPWLSVGEMDKYKKKYTTDYPHKINSEESFRKFLEFIEDRETRAKAERSRKRRVEQPFRVASLLPTVIKQCSRCALKGEVGFTRQYKASELIDFLNRHGIREYTHGKFSSRIDSNYCKNQTRRGVALGSLPLTADVFTILNLFTELDPGFNPQELLFSKQFIEELPPLRAEQLISLLPAHAETATWAREYREVLLSINIKIERAITVRGKASRLRKTRKG